MKFQNRIKGLYIINIFLFIVTIISISYFFIQREKDNDAASNINNLRSYTSSVVNYITEGFPLIDEVELDIRMTDINSFVLVTDLDSSVIYNSTSLSETNILNHLYQDQSYSVLNQDMTIASFPVKNESTVLGFIIFEIPTKELVETNYLAFYVLILIETILLAASSIYLALNYIRIIKKPNEKLNLALLDVSNGIYKTLKSNKGFSSESFTAYNIMLDKLENTLASQANYTESRKQLIANISHEIRTPLAYVQMSAEMLAKDQSISIENKKYIETILNKINSITIIIEDLFRYSKQDMNELLVELKEVYTKDMFDRIFSTIKMKEDEKNITLTIDNKVENILIKADESRLIQVVSNMVDNSLKHLNGQGYIKIKTELEENHLILTIEDSGEGIDSKDLPNIFEPFYQGSQNSIIKKKGAGLGLSICEYIIKKHEGEIFVYSELNKGTKFVIKFPEFE